MSLLSANNLLLPSSVFTPVGDELAIFEFDEGTGTSSANDGSNTIAAALLGAAAWRSGLYGSNAVEVTVASTANNIDVRFENINYTGDFSYCFLMETPAVHEGNYCTTGIGGNTATNNNYLAIYLQSNGKLLLLARNNSTTTQAYYPATVLATSTVYHVGFTYSTTNGGVMYLDGALEKNIAALNLDSLVSVDEFKLGMVNREAPIYGKGVWDSFRSWNRVIPQAEMAYYSDLRN